MVTQTDYLKVARQLKDELDGRDFLSKSRMEITGRVRAVSGEKSFRLKSRAAAELGDQLLNQGVRVHPSLEETTTGDVVRLFRTGTDVASLMDILANPGEDTDRALGRIAPKVKGLRDWAP